MKYYSLFAGTLVCAASLTSIHANATEGGGNAYPNGAEGFMAGALPPSGFYYQNFLNHYTVDKLADGNGHDSGYGINIQATADVSRFIYMTNHKLLGADWGMYTTIPLVHISGDLSVGDKQLANSSTDGLGDISISPLMLAWHQPNFHYAFALEVTTPSGEFNATSFANTGRNYWGFTPVFVATYLSNNFEASAKVMYDFNGKNDDTQYKSGQEFHFDYALGYHLNNYTVGLAGYYYQQMTNDKQNGEVYLEGYKGKVFAVGPAVKIDTQAGYSVELRYQKEMAAEYKPEGDKFWLKFTTKL